MAMIASFSSSAALVAVDEWHETRDSFGGLKESTNVDGVFYAVSKDNIFDIDGSYEIMSGYRLASSSEYRDLISATKNNYTGYVYYNHGGWNGYVYDGVKRVLFTFSDTSINGSIVHAGVHEKSMGVTGIVGDIHDWAGFVLIEDEASKGGVYDFKTSNFVAADVPAPFCFCRFITPGFGAASKKQE